MSKRKRAPRPARTFGYAVALVVNIVIWYIVHNLDTLHLSFILVDEFGRVLPAFEMALGATIVANACFIAFDPPFLRHGIQVLLNLLSLNVLWAVYRVVPYDFGSDVLNSVLRATLLLAVMGVSVATVVQLVQLVFGRQD